MLFSQWLYYFEFCYISFSQIILDQFEAFKSHSRLCYDSSRKPLFCFFFFFFCPTAMAISRWRILQIHHFLGGHGSPGYSGYQDHQLLPNFCEFWWNMGFCFPVVLSLALSGFILCRYGDWYSARVSNLRPLPM